MPEPTDKLKDLQRGNRKCAYPGCTVSGGSVYMDRHEESGHLFACSFGCGRAFGSSNGRSVHETAAHR